MSWRFQIRMKEIDEYLGTLASDGLLSALPEATLGELHQALATAVSVIQHIAEREDYSEMVQPSRVAKGKEGHMKSSQHCPGFEALRELESFLCTCPECKEEIEVFSDELHKKHICPKCGQQIDCGECPLYRYGGGGVTAPR